MRVPANSWITIDLSAAVVVNTVSVLEFDFDSANQANYDPFAQAFSIAISKRSANVKRNIHVPLSSGHDSGMIAAELVNQNIEFSSYGFKFGEIEEVIIERFDLLRNLGLKATLLQPSETELKQLQDTLLRELPEFRLTVGETPTLYPQPDFRYVSGFIASAYISRLAQSRGEIICLSGQGADEIISDYYNEHSNSRRSFFRGNWEAAIQPWPNFFGGWNKVFLEASERVIGHFGIETRYPFLDPQVIQSFLYLTPKAKGRAYKACISHRLEELKFPYHDRKIGFHGFQSELL
jgi:asparagine synthetase B (glutamine-hydrolysing)